jgi:predicted  nucleic acid-binding Zn-ribbon protein
MPHQCTTCGRTFPDGSKEMLSGCPDCGGNKFQFKPAGETIDPDETTDESAGSVTDTPDSESPRPDSQPPEAQTPNAQAQESKTPDAQKTDSEHIRDRTQEDIAQASARSDVVSPDELDQASRDVESDSPTGSDPDSSGDPEGPRPDIDDLRDELNEQFESIRIVSPGKYELNLMELYDRQEYIISLQEDGRYVIEMPDAWGISDE